MLQDFVRAHDLDIILVQEVTAHESVNITGYVSHTNIGSEMRGTAILAKKHLVLTDIDLLPSGRAIAAVFSGIRLINVYAPSGTTKRTEREYFFNSELPALLSAYSNPLLIGGDFNCILQPADTTGPFTTSRALAELTRGLALTDTWNQNPSRPTYTHYSPNGATRIDRIYLTKADIGRKTGIEIIPAAFTDHLAVVLRLALPAFETRKPRGRWKMNPALVHDTTFRERIRTEWAKWCHHKRFYPDVIMWWERHVKKHIQRLARQEEAERSKDHRLMEQHLYECLYDIIQGHTPETEKFQALQRYKAKIVRLHSKRRANILLDTHAHDRMETEEPSLFHVLKLRRRRADREIRKIQDSDGTIYTGHQDIARTFVKHLAHKFGPITVDAQHLTTILRNIQPTSPTKYAEELEKPLTTDEVLSALRAGARHKAPGIDGICLEFYQENWETIKSELTQLINYMLLHKRISSHQKHGILVCLPKTKETHTPDDFRPISLLTTEYNLLARILARRLRPILAEQLSTSQYCGVPGNSILDALANTRDVIAHYETTSTPLCVLSLDFQSAFDRISHQYLFHVLHRYGISQWFIERIQALYEDASASVQINGSLAGAIALRSGIRQGCPLSMVLYALCLHPLLRALEDTLPGLKVGRHKRTPVIAYADDVTVFVTHPEAFSKIHQAIKRYEQATGARLNPNKSRALAMNGWTEPATALGIPFHDRVNILGITFGPTTHITRQDSWTRIIREVRAQAQKSYGRSLCLAQRIQYVSLCLLAKLWYLAQTFLPTRAQAQQLTAICTWFLWQGAIFRVPVTTLQRPKSAGGWDFPHIEEKCKTLLYNRLQISGTTKGSIQAELLHIWAITSTPRNPPEARRLPMALNHLQQYAIDMAYVTPRSPAETQKLFKRRIYTTLIQLTHNSSIHRDLRIVRKYPDAHWNRVWNNLHSRVLPYPLRSTWYAVIHDIVPTNDRLADIQVSDTDVCTSCGQADSIQHRITDCGEGPLQWNWTRHKLGIILRMDPKYIPKEWTTRPDFQLWPPKRHAAVIWILAHLVSYRLLTNRRLSLRDYMDFMQRSRWKLCHKTGTCPHTGRYLEVIDWKRY